MSENVSDDARVIEAEPAQPVSSAQTTGGSFDDGSRYRRRFGVLYVVLALVAGAAVGALIVLVSRPDAAPTPSWSAWKPDGSRDAQVKQIADRVATHYRLPNGNQLAVALASPPKVSG